MMPYDGAGYGKSTYWTWQLRSIAIQNGEECACWENTMPEVKFKPDDDVIRVKIKCASKTALCKNAFPETEKALKEIFVRLYSDT
jgi:hypothetical protein